MSSRQKMINDAIIQQRVEANRRARDAASKLVAGKATVADIIKQRDAAKERVKEAAAAREPPGKQPTPRDHPRPEPRPQGPWSQSR